MEEFRTKQYGETDAKDYLPGAEELNADGDESEVDADTDGEDSEGWEEVDQSDVEPSDNDDGGDTTVSYGYKTHISNFRNSFGFLYYFCTNSFSGISRTTKRRGTFSGGEKVKSARGDDK